MKTYDPTHSGWDRLLSALQRHRARELLRELSVPVEVLPVVEGLRQREQLAEDPIDLLASTVDGG